MLLPTAGMDHPSILVEMSQSMCSLISFHLHITKNTIQKTLTQPSKSFKLSKVEKRRTT